jgi:cytosine/adenosine deaminase-related metal-dependent hydrolase
MSTLLVRNATVLVTMDDARQEIPGGGLYARDGIITAVGPSDTLPQTADDVLDASGQVVLPGLVNCHHHLDQTLTRNLPAGQDAELFDWLVAHYRIWARRTPEASRTATLVGLAELALSGCTTAFDHAYLFRNGCRVDDQIGAAAEIGMRFMVSRGSMSRGQSLGGLPPDDCVEGEADILADCERVIGRYHDASHGAMLRVVLAPCSPFSVTDGLLRDSATLARAHGVRLHTHLCETANEEVYTLAQHGMRPVEYMDSLGWVEDDVWFAHAVKVNDTEVSTLAHRGTGVCHCPTSNMRLASGIAPLRKYLDAGVHVGLGVDGSASNDGGHMLGEARQAMLLARLKLAVEPEARGYRRVAGGAVRGFLYARSERAWLRRRAFGPGGGGGVLRAADGAPHLGARAPGGDGRARGNRGYAAGDCRAQPARGPADRGMTEMASMGYGRSR